jgi:exopolysaccharide biosynthesis predicted pyruvyltransferase EpsI
MEILRASHIIQKAIEQIDAAIRPFVTDEPYCLLEFPDHSNAGDSAIWLGASACLERHYGHPPAYVCTDKEFNVDALREAAPHGPIYLKGGGSLGDVWPESEIFREFVIERFHDRPIVQLPQSISFTSAENIERARKVFSGHPNFTLMARDEASRLFANDELGVEAVLVPDTALYLGSLDRLFPPPEMFVGLLRTDKEKSEADITALISKYSIFATDWIYENSDSDERIRARFDGARNYLRYLNLARNRLRRGLSKLCLGEYAITDRLHGHILLTMLGIEHAALDNSYGKISNFVRTWTANCDLVTFVDTSDDLERWIVLKSEDNKRTKFVNDRSGYFNYGQLHNDKELLADAHLEIDRLERLSITKTDELRYVWSIADGRVEEIASLTKQLEAVSEENVILKEKLSALEQRQLTLSSKVESIPQGKQSVSFFARLLGSNRQSRD